MRKISLVALLVIVALVISTASPTLLKAQVGRASADDVPHHTVKAFAPFIRALVMRRLNTAEQIFKMHRNVETTIETPENIQILDRFQKPDSLELNLIGGRTLGNNIGILYFTIATEEGPVAFKIYYYGFEKDIYVARMDITDDWDQIEQAVTTLEMLPAPITTSLGGQIDENGQ